MGFDFGNFRFEPGALDLPSAGIGFAAGVGASYIYYLGWRALSGMRQDRSQQRRTGGTYAMRYGNRRFINEMIRLCQRSHLAGNAIDLSNILVEPRFLRASETITMPDEDDERPIFSVVPQVYDFPDLHAPYHLETLSIEEIGSGERALALLGLPGSGRTTALMSIALWSLGMLEFDVPPDPVQERLEEKVANLPDKERAEHIKQRFDLRDRAMEQMSADQSASGDKKGDSDEGSAFRHLIPMYVHLANMTLGRREYGRNVDPAEPLVRAIQGQLGYVAARTSPGDLYDYLSEGVGLILIDGLDELLPDEQRIKLAWLEAFKEAYERNFIIVAHTPQGAQALNRLDFVSVYLRPWTDDRAERLFEHWAENWAEISGQRRATVGNITLERVKGYSRNYSPFEHTLRVWSEYVMGDTTEEDKDEGEHIRDYLEKLGIDLTSDIDELAHMAALQLDEGYVKLDRLVELQMGLAANTLSGDDSEIVSDTISNGADDDFDALLEEDDDDFDDLFDEEDQAPTRRAATIRADDDEEDAQPTGKKAAKPEANLDREQAKHYRKIRKEQAAALKQMVNRGLLVRYRGNRYLFRHTHIAAYLASLNLSGADEQLLAQKSSQPTWETAIGYASQHTDIEAAVKLHLSAPADVLHNHLLQVARWLRFAGTEVSWRQHVLRALGNLFVIPNQYSLLRERIAAALVYSKDPGASKIFQKGLTSSVNDVRRIACLAAGAMQDENAIDAITRLFEDTDPDIRVAAALSLGAIATDSALINMVEEFQVAASKEVRQAIAEMLAMLPEQGYLTLYDAVHSEDIQMRRAAVFGLGRIAAPWAIEEIYRVYLDDPEWYAQTAAQTVFREIQSRHRRVPRKYPTVGAMPWMIQWALNPENEVPNNIGGVELLRYALEHPDPQIRLLALATIGQLGMTEVVTDVYHGLSDREDAIRDTAYRALAELQLQANSPLPAPVSD